MNRSLHATCFALLILMALRSPPSARASCAPIPGDLDGIGGMNVVDVQCGIVTTLWSLGGGGSVPACLAGGDVQLADVNCDGVPNVIDVQALILLALDLPLAPGADADGDGCVDACVAPPELSPRWAWVTGGATDMASDSYALRAVLGQWVTLEPAEAASKTLTPGVRP